MSTDKRKRGRWGLLIILGMFIYFVYVFIDQQKVLNAKKVEMQAIQSRIAEEQKLNEELKKQKEFFTSDEYVEKIAREKLGMVGSDEKVFVDINRR